ncbi:MAG: helix-turn-helix domain-containing protein [Flavobacteriaceae bacterium]|nr:helix-turn-helix domain-containing protein [Flavobacteriaceae bacterium]
MIQNEALELAYDFIENTDKNIFLTGKAGTGKTTFLHRIKRESLKRMVVVAPTGVAAINAKGVTIHSFFQLQFGPILPTHQSQSDNSVQRRFSKIKIDIIKSLDLLIIDEISMVRADVLDGIDEVLRRYKDRSKVFGGVQVLMIGDLQQLAPVIRPDEWQLLKDHYESAFFFSSKAYQQSQAVNIELKHIYRQENETFISVLNEVRRNALSDKSLKILNERFQPNFEPKKEDGYITLTTHNKSASEINKSQLDNLNTKSRVYIADIHKNFSEKNFPNDEHLQLKVGAQVMFIKNDSAFEKRYYNGKIGTITALNEDIVTVKCGEYDIIEVGTETWENIKYHLDKETQNITEVLEGSYTQIPLRLAWAITIHKSQGLTFEHAIIDAESAFAHGQTYVALSRCKTLEGMILKTPITRSSIVNDHTVDGFNQFVEENEPTTKDLVQAKKQFQLNLISELFNFHNFLGPIQRLISLYYNNQNVIEGIMMAPLNSMKDEGVIPLLKIANNFKLQLQKLSENTSNIASNETIQERYKKGLNYFKTQIHNVIKAPLERIEYTTDNKQLEKKLKRQLELLDQNLIEKLYCFEHLSDTFSTVQFLNIRAKATLEKPKHQRTSLRKSNLGHQNLFEELQYLRDTIAIAENIQHYQVFSQKSLYEICDDLPITKNQLLQIGGMGKIRVKKYGEEILDVIKAYCKANNIEVREDKPKAPILNTKQVSFGLFKSGLSISAIANKRNLTVNTIETHLSQYVSEGTLDITELIPKKKIINAKDLISTLHYERLSEVKEHLGADYSWGELRMILAWMQTD